MLPLVTQISHGDYKWSIVVIIRKHILSRKLLLKGRRRSIKDERKVKIIIMIYTNTHIHRMYIYFFKAVSNNTQYFRLNVIQLGFTSS